MRRRYRYDDDDDDFDENGLLKDGRSVRIRMSMMDSDHFDPVQQAMAPAYVRVTDGQSGTAGLHRPGFRIPANNSLVRARDAAYSDYERELTTAWRGNRSRPDASAEQTCPACEDSGEIGTDHQQRMAQLYDAYDTELREAWRHG
jgi:hypothetical protein